MHDGWVRVLPFVQVVHRVFQLRRWARKQSVGALPPTVTINGHTVACLLYIEIARKKAICAFYLSRYDLWEVKGQQLGLNDCAVSSKHVQTVHTIQ